MDTQLLLLDFIPHIPMDWAESFLVVGAVLGTIFLVYSVFVEQEHRSDLLRMFGAGGLLVYALYIQNAFFIVAMAALAIASAVEFIEILLGLHKHGEEDLKRYKAMWRRPKK